MEHRQHNTGADFEVYDAAVRLAQTYLEQNGARGIESRTFDDLVESFLTCMEAMEDFMA